MNDERLVLQPAAQRMSSAPHSVASSDSRLIRGIGRWDLVALLINGIVGAGIFGLPSRVHALVGVWGLLAYVACALLVLLIVLCFAEVASRFDRTGGPYLYARRAYGPFVGFQIGWLAWLSRLSAFAALCHLFVDYLGHFLHDELQGWPRAAVIVALVGTLAAINWIGVRQAARVGDAFTIAKLLPLLLFVGVGAFFVAPENFSLANVPTPDTASLSAAVLLLVFAFTGFESAVVPAGESRDPRRDLPFGLLVSLAIVAPLYIAIQVVTIGTLPDLAASTRPLADAAATFMGRAGAALIAIGALVSILGTLHGIMLSAPRMLFAMAEHGQLPASLATTHPRHHTPHMAIVAVAIVLLALTLGGSFIAAVTISTVARLFVYAATCAAVPVLRRRAGEDVARFAVPFGLATALLALVLIAWLLLNAEPTELRDVVIAMGIGTLILGLQGWHRRRALRAD
jgi:APA family basic amino acid/polyamine antiporter